MAWDKFLIPAGAGADLKLRGLSVFDRYVYFLGMHSIAHWADPRGSLTVNGSAAIAEDVAHACDVDVRVCRLSVARLLDTGLLVCSTDAAHVLHVCSTHAAHVQLACGTCADILLIRDWEQWQAKPRSDATNAVRQRRYRERHRNGRVTLRNAGEVEVKREGPPLPPRSRNASNTSTEATRDETTHRDVPTLEAIRAEHFPTEALSTIQAAAFKLRLRHQPITPDTIRRWLDTQR